MLHDSGHGAEFAPAFGTRYFNDLHRIDTATASDFLAKMEQLETHDDEDQQQHSGPELRVTIRKNTGSFQNEILSMSKAEKHAALTNVANV
jgi:hypothetical protein